MCGAILSVHRLSGGELPAAVVLAVWTLTTVLAALPWRGQRWLGRHNAGQWVANWTMFGARPGRPAHVVSYALEFLPAGADADTGWQVLSEGRPWSWHAALWQPERRVADRLHRLAQTLAGRSTSAETREQIRRRLVAYVHQRAGATASVAQIRVRARRSIIQPGGGRELKVHVIAAYTGDECR